MGFTPVDILLTLVPVLSVLVLMAVFKVPGDISGIVGWILVLIIAVAFFSTPVDVGLTASLKGLLASMAITGMGIFALLQITFLQETGALNRIVVLIKTIAKSDKVAQLMILNVCIGTILVSVGVTPVTILPPILLAMGYTTILAIALPAIGFDALCTYAMLGVTLVTMSDILTGMGFVMPGGLEPTVQNIAVYFANYLPVVTPCICIAITLMAGGPKLLVKGLPSILITGLSMGLTAMAVAHIGIGIVLTGVIAGIVGLACMLIYLKIRKIPLIDRSSLTDEDLEVEKSMPLWKAFAPWAILLFFCIITNFVAPIYDVLYKTFEMRIILWPGDSGQAMRIFWNAYFWVFVSTILATFIIRPKKGTWGKVVKRWLKRFPRPTIASIVFFMLAYVMMYSAYAPGADGVWVMQDETRNMIYIWAHAAADLFGSVYPIANSFLGLIAGFVTGSEASTVALFAKYNVLSADLLGFNPVYVIVGGAIGAGLSSVITPVKLQQAAATIDKIGQESMVLRKVVGYALGLVAVSALLTMVFVLTS